MATSRTPLPSTGLLETLAVLSTTACRVAGTLRRCSTSISGATTRNPILTSSAFVEKFVSWGMFAANVGDSECLLQMLETWNVCCKCWRLGMFAANVGDLECLLQMLETRNVCCKCWRLGMFAANVGDLECLLQMLETWNVCFKCWRLGMFAANVGDLECLL